MDPAASKRKYDWGMMTRGLPSGKRLRNYGKSPFIKGKSTISMAMFNSYVKLPEGKYLLRQWPWIHRALYTLPCMALNVAICRTYFCCE